MNKHQSKIVVRCLYVAIFIAIVTVIYVVTKETAKNFRSTDSETFQAYPNSSSTSIPKHVEDLERKWSNPIAVEDLEGKRANSSCSEPEGGWEARDYRFCLANVNYTEGAFHLNYTDSDRASWIEKCMNVRGYKCYKGDWIRGYVN